MSKSEMAKKGIYIGTGTGLIMFALVGFFPGSLIGGAIGLWLSKLVLGASAGAALLPRLITAVSMVAGIIGAAAFFVVGSSVVGWAIGTALDALRSEETEAVAVKHSSH